MPRYRLTLEYDGTPFSGWQIQPDGPSVQGAVEDALAAFTTERVIVRGAGRTDAGVHALGQEAHIDLDRDWDPGKLREAINFHLRPAPVAAISIVKVPDSFDARFSATARHYVYRILNRRAPPVLQRNHVWWVAFPLDAEAMQEAAQGILGHHDFTTFRAAACQAKSPWRTLDRLDVTRTGDQIRIDVSARSFLHNQVRSLAGSLKLVGAGKWPPAQLRAALDARDRSACGPVAPPTGLYLTRVDY
jgi:tRNA pseudouridine38-40 synthase